MASYSVSYLIVFISFFSLYLSSANYQARVRGIERVTYGDGVTGNFDGYQGGSLMGGFYVTIFLDGIISSPQDEVTIVFDTT